MTGADHRSVPLEVLRDSVRSYAELTSLRSVAEDAGVGRSTVHKFVAARTTPHRRVRRLLALWYIRRLGALDEMEVLRPYFAALDVLLGGAVPSVRDAVTLDVLRALEDRYTEGGQEVAHWVVVMRGRVTRGRPVL